MLGSTRVYKCLCRPCMPEYGFELWTLHIYVCVCICEACERCLSMELSTMKTIEVDFVVIWIFYSFNDVFVSSWVYKMFMGLIELLSDYHNTLHFPSGNKQTVTFYITPLEASCIAVLGHNWLTCYNPLIDWVLGSIKFHSLLQTDSLMSPETVAMAPLSSNPLTPTLLIAPKVSFINAAAFARLSKMDDNQVYQLFLSDKTAPDDAPPSQHDWHSTRLPWVHWHFQQNPCLCSCSASALWPQNRTWGRNLSPIWSNIFPFPEWAEIPPRVFRWTSCDGFHPPIPFARWSSSSVIQKKDGSLCLCVDFHSLNKIMKKDCYPLPCISNLLNSPCKTRFYSKINLCHVYHLVHIHEGDEWKTAFHTHYSFQMAHHALQTYKCACCLSTLHEWHLWQPAWCMHAGIPRWHPHLFQLWRRAYMACLRGTLPPLTA